MDSNQMTAQLAQFSQLEQLENLGTQFSSVLSTTQKSYANSLVGKTVAYGVTDSSGKSAYISGIVDAVDMANNETRLLIGKNSIALNDVLAVQ
jgi:flagellar basal-body rod modification protein FlgD